MKTLWKFLVIGASNLEWTIETFPVWLYDTREEAEIALQHQLARECEMELEWGDDELTFDEILWAINWDGLEYCTYDIDCEAWRAILYRWCGDVVIEIHTI